MSVPLPEVHAWRHDLMLTVKAFNTTNYGGVTNNVTGNLYVLSEDKGNGTYIASNWLSITNVLCGTYCSKQNMEMA